MIKILKNFFENKDSSQNDTNQNLELLCGLMIEAANSDGNVDTLEVNKIKGILVDIFEENLNEVNIYLEKAIQNSNNSNSLFYYTSQINKNYSDKKKLLLIETLWEIILSDGKVHDYESSLIRRLSGLLYISDVNSGNAKKKALDKINKKS